MIADPRHPALRLLELDDIDGEGMEPLRTVVTWAREYLCRPHPDLGRKGPVCPYAQSSLDRGQFYLALWPGVPTSVEAVARALLPYRDWFVRLAPAAQPHALFSAILVVFPDLPRSHHHVVDEAQRALKADYVSRGLMIGEFHDGPPDKPGLWNQDLRPLHSPVPLLAIRHMVPTDLPFLYDDPLLLSAYLRRYGDRVPTHLRALTGQPR